MNQNNQKTGYLKVTGGHKIYWEHHGNVNAQPVVVLHGGPGGGMGRKILKFFDLRKWRVLLFDQRGCGKSTPKAKSTMNHNTTWYLVEDIEALRNHFDISKWMVVGGSWGTTLALAYGQTYPERVTKFILRGIYTGTLKENEWVYGTKGASLVYPDEWNKFIVPILSRVKGQLNTQKILQAYSDLFLTDLTNSMKSKSVKNINIRKEAILAWNRWEFILCFLRCANIEKCPKNTDSFAEQEAIALIENYYFKNKCWLKPNQLLKNIKRIRNIPCIIIQGRYDLVCPMFTAMKLNKSWKKSKLVITLAGHATSDPENTIALKKAVKSFEK